MDHRLPRTRFIFGVLFAVIFAFIFAWWNNIAFVAVQGVAAEPVSPGVNNSTARVPVMPAPARKNSPSSLGQIEVARLLSDSASPANAWDDITGLVHEENPDNHGLDASLCQQPQRVNAEDQPRLVLNTGGPISSVRALAFSPDSTRVYTAGFDKNVQVWGVQGGLRAIQRAQANRAALVQTLRWEIARGQRGVIYALAASPVDRLLAIGGFSARGRGGHLMIYDSARDTVERMLVGHNETINHLSYSPNGQRLASVSVDGELRVWNTANWQSVVLRSARSKTFSPQPILFIHDNLLVVAELANEQGTSWRLGLYDLSQANPRPRLLSTLHGPQLTALARAPQGDRWASADQDGKLYLWQGENPNPQLLRYGRSPLSLSFANSQILFAANAVDENKQAVLEMWNVNSGEMLDLVQTAATEHNFACAVSPDGSRVVTYGGDDNEAWIFLLQDARGNLLSKPLSQGNLVTRGGTGQKVWHVAFADDGSYKIGFGTQVVAREQVKFNQYGSVQQGFDLQHPTLLPPALVQLRTGPGRELAAARAILRKHRAETAVEQLSWRTPDTGAGAWTVVRERDGLLLRVQRDGVTMGRITLDPVVQGRARSYCWLPHPQTGATFALAVGTDQQNTVFVYQLQTDGECPLLRSFRDHRDWVTSISVSRDGKYLATASIDQTINIWSLEGLYDNPGPFQQSIGWGATFAKRDGKVLVQSALDAGIAARRDLRPGDTITAVQVAVQGQLTKYNDPDEIYQVLENTPLWREVVVSVDRAPRQRAILRRMKEDLVIRPAWEPLLSLFVDRRGEWALWTPQGFYEASVNGDELFGWQINRGLDKRPEYFRADQFRADLERPQVIRRLLSVGNLPAALRQANVELPVEPNDRLVDLALKTTEIEIIEPRDGVEYPPGASIKVQAKMRFPEGKTVQDFRPKAFVNGIPAGQFAAGPDNTLTWEINPADPYNRVRVRVAEAAVLPKVDDDLDTNFSFRDVHVRARIAAAKPRLHLLTLAAKDYPGALKLNYTVKDADSIKTRLLAKARDFYEIGTVKTLRDRDITKETVAQTVTDLKHDLRDAISGDLLVVFIAGHGIAFDKDYYLVTIDEKVSRLSSEVNEPADEAKLQAAIRAVGIPWAQLRALSDVKCRKLFLLDTCFAGNVRLAENPTAHLKAAIRPLNRAEVLVVSATDVDQEALEFRQFEHGVFTKCLLDGMDGQADGMSPASQTKKHDGHVDLLEIIRYVESEVPRITEKLQRPTSTPLDLVELLYVPLVSY